MMQESQGQWYKSWDEEPESSKERALTVPAIFQKHLLPEDVLDH